MLKIYAKVIPILLLVVLSIFTWSNHSFAVPFELHPPIPDNPIIKPGSMLTNSAPGGQSWITSTWIFGTTVFLYQNDAKVNELFDKGQNETADDISHFVEHFGNNYELIPALGFFYLSGLFFQNEKSSHCALLSMESLFLATFFTNVLKFLGHRSRPYTGESYDYWGEPSFENENSCLSFPSGHAASAFSIATVIAAEYKDKPFVPVAAYSIATLTAISRVYDNKHWASDIFVGSVIGYYTGKLVIKLNAQTKNNLTITPVLQGDNYGLAVYYRF